MNKTAVLIIVENLPVPLDRRVWQESCALRDAGYEVIVICPRMRGHNAPEEKLEGIQIYRHWISEEAGGFIGFFREYTFSTLGRMVAGLEGVAPAPISGDSLVQSPRPAFFGRVAF